MLLPEHIIAVILTGVRFSIWCKNNPEHMHPDYYSIRKFGVFVLLLIKCYSLLAFIGMLLISVVYLGLNYSKEGLSYVYPLKEFHSQVFTLFAAFLGWK